MLFPRAGKDVSFLGPKADLQLGQDSPESQNSLGWRAPSRVHLIKNPSHRLVSVERTSQEQRHLPREQAAHSPTQLHLGASRGTHHLSGRLQGMSLRTRTSLNTPKLSTAQLEPAVASLVSAPGLG